MLEDTFLKPCPFCGEPPCLVGSVVLDGSLEVRCVSCQKTLAEEEGLDKVVESANHRYCTRCVAIAGAASTALHWIREAILSGLPDRTFNLTPQQKRSLVEMVDSFDPRVDGEWPC